MRIKKANIALALGAMALCSVGTVKAAVTISSAVTANMTCADGICAPTAEDAVLNAGNLETLLAVGNVTITTTGTGIEASDIAVKAPLSWSSKGALSLLAEISVAVDQPFSILGRSGLTIRTDPAIHNGSKNGALIFGKQGNVTFANLSSVLSINGDTYTLVGDIKTLASDIARKPARNFALANSYDASADGTYPASPIPIVFTGKFDGLGHEISNLSIADATDTNVGLFAVIGRGGEVSNVHIVHADISATATNVSAGPLAGTNSGVVLQASASGKIGSELDGSTGGLVGYSAGVITRSEASTSVDGQHAQAHYGGLVGQMAFSQHSPIVTDSHASGDVIGACGSDAGGLVGAGAGFISNSYATGRTHGTGVGGLVGFSDVNISDSYASGSVEVCNSGNGGGLVANQGGALFNSYATGNVTGKPYSEIGGLIGFAESNSVTHCHASGNVTGGSHSYVGGFVGQQIPTAAAIEESYSTGSVNGGSYSYVGGFAGVNVSVIDQSWASGSVTGGRGAYVGGLIGYNYAFNGNGGAASVTNSYSAPSAAAPNIRGGRNAIVGGLIGYNVMGATVSSSYSTGAPSAKQAEIGGVVGYDASFNGVSSGFTNVYWDTTTSGISNLSQAAGNVINDPGMMGLTTLQLQAGLPTGFESTIWSENSATNGGLPYLLANVPQNAGIDGSLTTTSNMLSGAHIFSVFRK